jgi:general secretion pathway protein M
MSALPEGRRGQALALTLTLLGLWAAASVVVTPIVDLYEDRQTALDQAAEKATRMARIAAERPALEARAAARAVSAGGAPGAKAPETDSIAGAELAAQVKILAGQTGVTVQSSEAATPEIRGTIHKVAVTFRLSGPYAGLVNLLAKLGEISPAPQAEGFKIQTNPGDAAVQASLDLAALRDIGASK